MDEMDPSRRRFLLGSAVVSAGGLTGCLRLSGDSQSEGGEPTTAADQTGDSGAATPDAQSGATTTVAQPQQATAEDAATPRATAETPAPETTATPRQTTTEPPQSGSDGVDYGGWFEDVGNFDGTVDWSNRQEITITVGAEGNGGNLAFDPPAVRVKSGALITFEWTGKGGAHTVTYEDSGMGLDGSGAPVSEAGHTFEDNLYYIELEDNVVKYYCEPHRALGMKGAIVVEPLE